MGGGEKSRAFFCEKSSSTRPAFLVHGRRGALKADPLGGCFSPSLFLHCFLQHPPQLLILSSFGKCISFISSPGCCCHVWCLYSPPPQATFFIALYTQKQQLAAPSFFPCLVVCSIENEYAL